MNKIFCFLIAMSFCLESQVQAASRYEKDAEKTIESIREGIERYKITDEDFRNLNLKLTAEFGTTFNLQLHDTQTELEIYAFIPEGSVGFMTYLKGLVYSGEGRRLSGPFNKILGSALMMDATLRAIIPLFSDLSPGYLPILSLPRHIFDKMTDEEIAQAMELAKSKYYICLDEHNKIQEELSKKDDITLESLGYPSAGYKSLAKKLDAQDIENCFHNLKIEN